MPQLKVPEAAVREHFPPRPPKADPLAKARYGHWQRCLPAYSPSKRARWASCAPPETDSDGSEGALMPTREDRQLLATILRFAQRVILHPTALDIAADLLAPEQGSVSRRLVAQVIQYLLSKTRWDVALEPPRYQMQNQHAPTVGDPNLPGWIPLVHMCLPLYEQWKDLKRASLYDASDDELVMHERAEHLCLVYLGLAAANQMMGPLRLLVADALSPFGHTIRHNPCCRSSTACNAPDPGEPHPPHDGWSFESRLLGGVLAGCQRVSSVHNVFVDEKLAEYQFDKGPFHRLTVQKLTQDTVWTDALDREYRFQVWDYYELPHHWVAWACDAFQRDDFETVTFPPPHYREHLDRRMLERIYPRVWDDYKAFAGRRRWPLSSLFHGQTRYDILNTDPDSDAEYESGDDLNPDVENVSSVSSRTDWRRRSSSPETEEDEQPEEAWQLVALAPSKSDKALHV